MVQKSKENVSFTSNSGFNELLNSWNPIHFCKTYTNNKMAKMMGVYVLLPSGVKDEAVKTEH